MTRLSDATRSSDCELIKLRPHRTGLAVFGGGGAFCFFSAFRRLVDASLANSFSEKIYSI